MRRVLRADTMASPGEGLGLVSLGGRALLLAALEGKSALVPGEDGRVVVPRPSAKPRHLVVGKGLLDLLPRVHHKGAVLRDRLVDGSTLEHEDPRGRRRVRVVQLRLPVGGELRLVIGLHLLTADLEALALIEVDVAVHCAAPGCCRQREPPARLKGHQPNRHVVPRIGGPRICRRPQRFLPHEFASPNRHLDTAVVGLHSRDLFPPVHDKRRLNHLLGRGQVQPNLEKLESVRRLLVN
mmetsp:Transcript_37838/g.89841  ORF Transcript_37838/g.89841 Transcript_37838/m.89841 type:complete len:239 (+) Transcript_37838:113-829(+)